MATISPQTHLIALSLLLLPARSVANIEKQLTPDNWVIYTDVEDDPFYDVRPIRIRVRPTVVIKKETSSEEEQDSSEEEEEEEEDRFA